jgi:hypothetical protein
MQYNLLFFTVRLWYGPGYHSAGEMLCSTLLCSCTRIILSSGQANLGESKKVGVALGLGMPGKQNPLPMNSAKEWVKILPNACLLRIPRFGHLPFVEQPDIFYPAVEQFLNGENRRGTLQCAPTPISRPN